LLHIPTFRWGQCGLLLFLRSLVHAVSNGIHDLEAFQTAFARHKSLTETARKSSQHLGYARFEVIELVQRIRRSHFVKSMTSYDNHRQWQDVYIIEDRGQQIYLKFTDNVLTEFILLSFKRK
jgi:motility quorum-sensing regulator/GCU-specific mRNA interferase toxin